METTADIAEMFRALSTSRHSTRGFLPEPASEGLIQEVLHTAQSSPSWCNVQPWRTYLLGGEAVSDLSARMMAVKRVPEAFDLPQPERYTGVHQERRRGSGYALYGALGIARDDYERRLEQAWENYRFFGAPHLAVITSTTLLGTYAYIDTGAYIAHLVLAARSFGMGSIALATIGGRSDVVRPALKIPDDEVVIAGVAFGWEDPDHPANAFRTARADLDEVVVRVDRLARGDSGATA